VLSVLPSYQKVEIGKFPIVAGSESLSLNLQITRSQISAAVEVLEFRQFFYLIEFNFNKPLAFHQQPDVLKRLISTHENLRFPYRSVTVAIETATELLPEGFLRHTGKAVTEKIHSEIFATYELNEKLLQTLQEHYQHPALTSVSANFLRQVIALPKGAYVQVMNHAFLVAVLEAPNKLLLFNTFEYGTEEDFLYFLLLACENTGIQRHEAPLVFSGKIRKQSKIYEWCQRYFADIVFLQPGNGKFFSNAFGETERILHFSLFTL
jgi:hypothetical protein